MSFHKTSSFRYRLEISKNFQNIWMFENFKFSKKKFNFFIIRIINSMVEWKWSIFNDSRWSFGTVLQRQRGGDFVLIRFSFFNPSSPHNNNYQILHLSQNEKFYLPNQNKKKWATVKMVHISSVPPWKTHLHWFKQKKNVKKMM